MASELYAATSWLPLLGRHTGTLGCHGLISRNCSSLSNPAMPQPTLLSSSLLLFLSQDRPLVSSLVLSIIVFWCLPLRKCSANVFYTWETETGSDSHYGAKIKMTMFSQFFPNCPSGNPAKPLANRYPTIVSKHSWASKSNSRVLFLSTYAHACKVSQWDLCLCKQIRFQKQIKAFIIQALIV